MSCRQPWASSAGRKPKSSREALVPGGGHVVDGEVAAEQAAFEVEAQQDVEIVGGLVGFHPDRRELGAADGGEEVVERQVARGGESSPARGIPVFPEARERPTWFSHSRDCDSWMPSETAVPDGQSEVVGGQALFVDPVAGLVQHAEERGGEVVLVVAGGEADVARAEPGAERMGGGVDAAGVEIEADRLGDLAVEGLLVLRSGRGRRAGGRRAAGGLDRGGGDFARAGRAAGRAGRRAAVSVPRS